MVLPFHSAGPSQEPRLFWAIVFFSAEFSIISGVQMLTQQLVFLGGLLCISPRLWIYLFKPYINAVRWTHISPFCRLGNQVQRSAEVGKAMVRLQTWATGFEVHSHNHCTKLLPHLGITHSIFRFCQNNLCYIHRKHGPDRISWQTF